MNETKQNTERASWILGAWVEDGQEKYRMLSVNVDMQLNADRPNHIQNELSMKDPKQNTYYGLILINVPFMTILVSVLQY
jgi:hypothetical protein